MKSVLLVLCAFCRLARASCHTSTDFVHLPGCPTVPGPVPGARSSAQTPSWGGGRSPFGRRGCNGCIAALADLAPSSAGREPENQGSRQQGERCCEQSWARRSKTGSKSWLEPSSRVNGAGAGWLCCDPAPGALPALSRGGMLPCK